MLTLVVAGNEALFEEYLALSGEDIAQCKHVTYMRAIGMGWAGFNKVDTRVVFYDYPDYPFRNCEKMAEDAISYFGRENVSYLG